MRRPNYTQVPNEFIEMMHLLSPTEIQVMLVIFRKTIGYHKDVDAISYSQIMEMTGIANRGTVKRAIDGLIQKRLIDVIPYGQSFKYTCSMSEHDQNTTCSVSEPEPVQPLNTQKKKESEGSKDPYDQEAVVYFSKRYEEVLGKKPTNSWGAMRKFFKTVLRAYSLEEVQQVVDGYFAYERGDYSFSTLRARWDSVAPKVLKAKPKQKRGWVCDCGHENTHTGGYCLRCGKDK